MAGLTSHREEDGRRTDPHFPTALSFPLTLALVFYKLRLVTSLRGAGEVRVVLIGAAARTEERLLLETSYWAEAGHLLPTIDGLHLCFVGPEVRGRRALCGRWSV